MKMIEVEFRCINCDRIVYELYPEDTDFHQLDTMFEHDFDCMQLDLEEDENN